MTWKKKFIALFTITKKEIFRFTRIWVQTVLPPAITVILYFVIFGNLIGSQIRDIGKVSYIEYIVPGVILMTVITNSYANVVSSFYSAKFQKHIEEMLVSPVPNFIILIGYIFGGVARGVAVGSVVILVSAWFVDYHIYDLTTTIAVIFLTSVLFSIAGLINAIFAKTFDDISIIPTFVLTPLTYLGGVFYSVDMLPDFWQQVSLLNPILYMVSAFRFGILGISEINIFTAFLIIGGFIILLFSFALYLLNKGTGIRT